MLYAWAFSDMGVHESMLHVPTPPGCFRDDFRSHSNSALSVYKNLLQINFTTRI